jgi:hypothetical protein
MVRPSSNGLAVNCDRFAEPAASRTTIVSPTALEIARMNAATSPETAAGITTFTDVVIFRAPRP